MKFHGLERTAGDLKLPIGTLARRALMGNSAVLMSLRMNVARPMPTADTADCIWCGRPTNSGEHMFSRWTHRILPPRKTGRVTTAVSIEHLDGPQQHWTGKMPGQMRDWKINCVCGGTRSSCNSGWMKAIEDEAKPAMTPLIVGEEIRLLPTHQRIVATWAVLKNMIANHRSIPREHLDIMWRDHAPPPEGWGVWIGHFERMNWKPEWLTRLFTVLPDGEYAARPSPDVDFSNGSATTMVLNKLLIHVGHGPDVHFGHRWEQFERPNGQPVRGLFRIWPAVRETSVRWPSRALSDSDADAVANDLISRIARIAQRQRKDGPRPP